MTICRIYLPSYTYANKAKRALMGMGYMSEMKRNEKVSESGCGYSLMTHCSCYEVSRILKDSYIPFRIAGEEGDEE